MPGVYTLLVAETYEEMDLHSLPTTNGILYVRITG
jgi:hypothetical protein